MTFKAQETGAKPSEFTEFDFVIVGGGLSGLVLAARLSENSDVTVGVLESGFWRPDDPKITNPHRMLEMTADPDYQFCSFTVPQKNVTGRRLALPRGRGLGGGSTVNYMVCKSTRALQLYCGAHL
jgi:choline dehydrogenase-like flavoprotein